MSNTSETGDDAGELEMGQPTVDGKIEFISKNFDKLPDGEEVEITFNYKGDRWELQMWKCGCRDGLVDVTVRLWLMKKTSLGPITTRIDCAYDSTADSSCNEDVLDDSKHFTECVLHIDEDFTEKDLKFEIQLMHNDPERSAKALKWLFESETFGDVTIVTADGKKLRCHRDILARRSEVFRQKFNVGSNEPAEVNVEGFNLEIVTEIVSFIYTNECGNIGPIADRLYLAAKEFGLASLKVICESAMAANLSAKTIVKTFKLATDENLDDLWEKCVDFMACHKAELSIEDLVAEALKMGAEPKAKRPRKK